MPITFSHLLSDKAFDIQNRRDIKALYDALKEAVKNKKVKLEGHSLPSTMNEWIKLVEGDKKLLSRDIDVVDFSLAHDKKFQTWRHSYLDELAKTKEANKTISISQSAYDLLVTVQALQEANSNSMQLINGNKDDVIAGLSDMQGAAYLLLDTYDRVRESLKLPSRAIKLERVKIKQPKAKEAKKHSEASSAKVKAKTTRKKRNKEVHKDGAIAAGD